MISIIEIKFALLASIFDLLEPADLDKIDVNRKKSNLESLEKIFFISIL